MNFFRKLFYKFIRWDTKNLLKKSSILTFRNQKDHETFYNLCSTHFNNLNECFGMMCSNALLEKHINSLDDIKKFRNYKMVVKNGNVVISKEELLYYLENNKAKIDDPVLTIEKMINSFETHYNLKESYERILKFVLDNICEVSKGSFYNGTINLSKTELIFYKYIS